MAQLNKTYSYSIPNKIFASYYPAPFQSNPQIDVKMLDGQEDFSLEIVTENEWQPGLYYICLFAALTGAAQDQVISTRTILLTPQ